jgi:carbamoyl-phosphate synthase large subunit
VSAGVVLTGVGLDGGPDIIRALRADRLLGARVVGVDASPDQSGRHLCDAFHLVPPRDDPGYVDAVAAIAEAEGAALVYPLPTFDQQLFADARAALAERGVAVAVSPPGAVRTCNDKWLLYEHLLGRLPELVPATRRVTTADELAAAARELGYPERRVCIRRRVSRGAIGLRLLDAGPDRLAALLEQNPGSLLVSLDEVLDVLGQAEAFPEYLVQEYLPGEEWDVDVLCRGGEAVIVATRRNLGMAGGAATRSVLEPAEEIAAFSRQVVADLGLDAIVNLAFRPDERGRPLLLEVNPRIPQSILTALGGGVNLPALAVRQALGERIEPLEPRWGGEFLRHFRSVVLDPSGTPVSA